MFYVDGADQLGEWPTDMSDIVEEYSTLNHNQAADLDLVSEILKEHEGIDLDTPPPPSPYSPSETVSDNVSEKLDIVLKELASLKEQQTASATASVTLIASLMTAISDQASKIVSLEKQIASCEHCRGKKVDE